MPATWLKSERPFRALKRRGVGVVDVVVQIWLKSLPGPRIAQDKGKRTPRCRIGGGRRPRCPSRPELQIRQGGGAADAQGADELARQPLASIHLDAFSFLLIGMASWLHSLAGGPRSR